MTYRIGFIIEQMLGHLTHQSNLAAAVAADPRCRPIWMPIPYAWADRWTPLPIIGGNLSMSLSLRARSRVASYVDWADALFFHTQVTAMFSLGVMRKVPSVISLDATPANRSGHSFSTAEPEESDGRVAWAKRLWLASTLRSAAVVVAWSRWCAQSVIRDYGVPEDRVRVIPPGINLDVYTPRSALKQEHSLPRILFVGGDFRRKGGPLLLEAFRSGLRGRCELDLVTNESGIECEGGVRVHRGLAPNSEAIRSLYAGADIFALPTQQDYTPLAILEAMASGLPVVAHDVGAIREQVADGSTGFLLRPARDARALAEALRTLIDDPTRRRGLGAAGRAHAEANFGASDNYGRLLGVLRSLSQQRAAGRRMRREVRMDWHPTADSRVGGWQA
jgi:glycosyltransferase involved in cell wall biosynthesis